MKKVFLVLLSLFVLSLANFCTASEVSSDKMILEWTTSKVWVHDGDLCMTGYFKNYRDDIVITKLNSFVTIIEFTRDDGSKFCVRAVPKKMPLCKINGRGTKVLKFNLGPFKEKWQSWITDEEYEFTFVGLR